MRKSESPVNNLPIITVAILVTLALVGILAYAMLTSSGILTTQETTQPPVFITINEPVPGDNLDLTWTVNVSGQAGGLFNGALIVQALDAAGNIIAQEPTTINSPEGGAAAWSVELSINAPAGSQGQIVAFSPSPADDSWIAEDRIDIGFGEDPFKKELVRVEDHLWNLVTLNERPPNEDTMLTLQFESFQAGGFGGCNNFRTSYERSGTGLNFGFVTSTAKECEIPAGVMAQESAYSSALEQITTYKIENTQLILVDNSGVERLVYDAIVMGNILGQDGIQLPEDAAIFVHLKDSSLAEGNSNLISKQQISGTAQLPMAFSMIYNPKQIIDDHAYVVEVQIENDLGDLLFVNSIANRVITAGYPSIINVLVEPAEEESN